MRSLCFLIAVSLLATTTPALAATYSLSDNVVGSAFYNYFQWENIADPTNGRV